MDMQQDINKMETIVRMTSERESIFKGQEEEESKWRDHTVEVLKDRGGIEI